MAEKNWILIEYFRIEYYYLKGFEWHYLLVPGNRIANTEYFRIAFEYQLFARISNISNTPPSPGGPEKNFFPRNFFCSKTLFIGSWLGFGPKKLILDPSKPPTRGHFGPFYTQNGQNGIQKRPKNAFFHKFFFALNQFISVPRWSGTLKNPKLAF